MKITITQTGKEKFTMELRAKEPLKMDSSSLVEAFRDAVYCVSGNNYTEFLDEVKKQLDTATRP